MWTGLGLALASEMKGNVVRLGNAGGQNTQGRKKKEVRKLEGKGKEKKASSHFAFRRPHALQPTAQLICTRSKIHLSAICICMGYLVQVRADSNTGPCQLIALPIALSCPVLFHR